MLNSNMNSGLYVYSIALMDLPPIYFRLSAKNGGAPGKDKFFLFCTRLHGSQRKSTKIVALISILIKRRSKNVLPLTFAFHCATNAYERRKSDGNLSKAKKKAVESTFYRLKSYII